MSEIPRQLPSPIPHPFTVRFWSAASEGNFLVPRCRACSRAHWYPRPFCPHCYSVEIEWEKASGRAKVHSFTYLNKDKQIVAYVELNEGPIILTNIVETDPATLAIGSPLEVTFTPSVDGVAVPVFRGAGA
jgi:uncharacterized OB-fold protein